MPVDTSIYANAAPAPVNPLAVAGQVAGIQNAQNQNRLFNQEFAARKAVGQAYQGALDPATGQIDVNKLVAGVANNPAAAFKAGEVGAQALEQQRGQTALSKEQLDNANTHFQTLADRFGSLAANPNLSYKDFIQTGGDLIAQGMSRPQDVTGVLGNLPPNATPQQLQAFAKQLQLQALHGSERVQAMYGSPMLINNGAGQQAVSVSPMMGTTTPLSPQIANELSPGERAARIPTFVNGQPGSVPQSAITDPYGNALIGQQPAGNNPLGSGRYPGQSTPAASGASSAGGPAGFVPSGPKMGEGAAADVTATGSAKSLQALHDDVGNSGTRIAQLQTALGALQNARTGAGSDSIQAAKSFLMTLSPETAKGLGVDPERVNNYDEANKYLTAYAMNQAGALGEGTDTKLATALTANASTHISNLAAQDVVKANIGLERMKQAQALAFDASGQSPSQFSKWQTTWNKTVDPRAFVADQMTPEQYSKVISTLTTPQAKANFAKSLRNGIKAGLISIPGEQNAAQ